MQFSWVPNSSSDTKHEKYTKIQTWEKKLYQIQIVRYQGPPDCLSHCPCSAHRTWILLFFTHFLYSGFVSCVWQLGYGRRESPNKSSKSQSTKHLSWCYTCLEWAQTFSQKLGFQEFVDPGRQWIEMESGSKPDKASLVKTKNLFEI